MEGLKKGPESRVEYSATIEERKPITFVVLFLLSRRLLKLDRLNLGFQQKGLHFQLK